MAVIMVDIFQFEKDDILEQLAEAKQNVIIL